MVIMAQWRDQSGFSVPEQGDDVPVVRCLGIVHIPKTAGAALRDALSRVAGCYTGPSYFDWTHFGSADVLNRIPDPNRSTVVSDELGEIVQSHRALIGHYSTRTLLDAGCKALATQVREPRARILSLYRFWQSTSEQERADWGPWGASVVSRADVPFVDFLQTSSVWPVTENAIARQLLGEPYKPPRVLWHRRPRRVRRRVSCQHFSRYRDFCRYLKVVDWSDRAQGFVERVCEFAQLPEVPVIGRINVTRVTGEPERLTGDALRLLERLTASDRSLLDALMSDGLLARRSDRLLDDEFRRAAEALDFMFG